VKERLGRKKEREKDGEIESLDFLSSSNENKTLLSQISRLCAFSIYLLLT
jgi:hypothetical protein